METDQRGNGARESDSPVQCLNPAVNSFSYLALLDLVLPHGTAPQEVAEAVVDKIVTFLLTFDARQIRFAGSMFSSIFGLVATGQMVPVWYPKSWYPPGGWGRAERR